MNLDKVDQQQEWFVSFGLIRHELHCLPDQRACNTFQFNRLLNDSIILVKDTVQCFDAHLEAENEQRKQAEHHYGHQCQARTIVVPANGCQTEANHENGDDDYVEARIVSGDHTLMVVAEILQIRQWRSVKVIEPVVEWMMAIVAITITVFAQMPLANQGSGIIELLQRFGKSHFGLWQATSGGNEQENTIAARRGHACTRQQVSSTTQQTDLSPT